MTGTRIFEPLRCSSESMMITTTAIAAPMPMICFGRPPSNTPNATVPIRLACGAGRCSLPIVYEMFRSDHDHRDRRADADDRLRQTALEHAERDRAHQVGLRRRQVLAADRVRDVQI